MQLANGPWISWDAGVDLVGALRPDQAAPSLRLSLARTVHTPVGSAPAGLIHWRPEPGAPPALLGFVSPDPEVARYLGALYPGTPLEGAPALDAALIVVIGRASVTARVQVAAHLFELELAELGPPQVVQRAPAARTPFVQQGIELTARRVRLKVDGAPLDVLPLAPAIWSPCGLHARCDTTVP